MPITIRARFDGKVLVPEEPLDLPQNQWLDFEWKPKPEPPSMVQREQARLALEGLLHRAVHGANIPDEALRRESLYEERP